MTIKKFDSFCYEEQLNESIWSKFLEYVQKGEEKMFSIFDSGKIKKIQTHIKDMSPDEQEKFIDELNAKLDADIKKSKITLGLLSATWVINLIAVNWLDIDINSPLWITYGSQTSMWDLLQPLDVTLGISFICWILAYFRKNSKEVVKEKISKIIKKIPLLEDLEKYNL